MPRPEYKEYGSPQHIRNAAPKNKDGALQSSTFRVILFASSHRRRREPPNPDRSIIRHTREHSRSFRVPSYGVDRSRSMPYEDVDESTGVTMPYEDLAICVGGTNKVSEVEREALCRKAENAPPLPLNT